MDERREGGKVDGQRKTWREREREGGSERGRKIEVQ